MKKYFLIIMLLWSISASAQDWLGYTILPITIDGVGTNRGSSNSTNGGLGNSGNNNLQQAKPAENVQMASGYFINRNGYLQKVPIKIAQRFGTNVVVSVYMKETRAWMPEGAFVHEVLDSAPEIIKANFMFYADTHNFGTIYF